MTAWDVELQAASVKQPLALGVEGRLVPRSGVSSGFKVTLFEPGRRYAFETALPLARLTIRRELQPQGDATTFTHEVRFSGVAGPVFAALPGPRLRAALPAAMVRIAEIATEMP